MFFLRVKSDWKALFVSESGHFDAIDGLRSLSCIMITALHVIILINPMLPPYPDQRWIEYTKSIWFSSLAILGFSLETFFLLSGFLLTRKLIADTKKYSTFSSFISDYVSNSIRRAFRFWPGIGLCCLIMCVLGDLHHRSLSSWFFFQNLQTPDEWAFGVYQLWSVSLDMQIHLFLPILYYFSYLSRTYLSISTSFSILIVMSILFTFFTFDPLTMNIVKATTEYSTLSMVLSKDIVQWIRSHYNIQYPRLTVDPNPMQVYMKYLYFPFWARFGTFLFGSVVSIQLNQIQFKPSPSLSMLIKTAFFVFFTIMVIFLTLPIVETANLGGILLIFSVCSARPLFACCLSFILYTTLCPSTETLHCRLLKKFLSLSMWRPIAKLSYFVYVLHFRLGLELILNWNLFPLDTYAIGYSVFFNFSIIFLICLIIGCLFYLFVECPFQRLVDQVMFLKSHQN